MILGVPTLCRYDLLDLLLESAERGSVKPSGYIIVDNGGKYDRVSVWHKWIQQAMDRGASVEIRRPGRNLGVAASWNLIIDRSCPVVISNDDVILGPDTFAELCEAISRVPFVTSEGMSLFAIAPECIATVGRFDEIFWPAYFEDIDYHRRVGLAGIPNGAVHRPESHGVSATRDSMNPADAAFIHDGFRKNQDYYEQKWGGPQGQETWTVPFNGER